MKYLRTSSFALLLASGLMFALSGCSTVELDATGDKEAVYQINEFRMVVNATAAQAFAAAQKATRAMDLFETSSNLEAYSGEIYARSRDDEKVFVGISEVNSRQALIKIRWGVIGDKKNSTALYKQIESNLR